MVFSDDAVIRLEPGVFDAITDVPGVAVGHYTDETVYRGVTAILTTGGAIAGVSVRGSNPGTIHTDALGPTTIGGYVHGIGLSGGSLFGLGAIAGIAEWLLHQGIGLQLKSALIPIVPGAVIYDMDLSDPMVHPRAEWGHKAAAAATNGAFERGNVGAGRGGTAGKGPGGVRTKGGLGTASLRLPGGIVVGALVVINALGSLVHPATGELYATGGRFDIPLLYQPRDDNPVHTAPLANTTLGVVATNAALDNPALVKIADLAHDGLARAIRPMHAMRDGDTVFALATHTDPKTLPNTTGPNLTDMVGAAAADAMVRAVLDAAARTAGVGDWPSVAEAQQAIRERGRTARSIT